MKAIVYFVTAAFMVIFVACGSSPKMIEDQQMESIITQCIITNAMIDVNRINVDTLDPYAAIFEKEGVTFEDVKYTIDKMAARKSNPLDNMFTTIRDKVDSIAAVARHKANVKAKFDSVALAFIIDTLIFDKRTVKGSPAKLKYKDKSLKIGNYWVKFNYKSNDNYEIGVPTLKITTFKNGKPSDKTVWITRSSIEIPFEHNFQIDNQGVDSIVVRFDDPIITKKGKKMVDSSYVKNFFVYFVPPIDKSRKIYFEHITNIKIDINYGYSKDSLLAPFSGWANR